MRIIIILLLLTSGFSFSQNQRKADSLISILKAENLSARKQLEHLISLAYNHPDIDTAYFLSKQSLQLANQLDDDLLIARAYEEISHKENILGNINASFSASFSALKIYENLQMTEQQAAAYNQIAVNYMSSKNYDAAIAYLKKAINIYRVKDENSNLIFTQLNLGEMYRLSGKLDTATTTFNNVLNDNKRKKEKNAIAEGYSLGNLGMISNTKGDLASAKVYLNAAIEILSNLKDSYSISIYTTELGEVYAKEMNFEVAEEKFLQGLEIAKGSNFKQEIHDFSKKLSEFYETTSRPEKALRYIKLHQTYKDSLVNKENIERREQIKAGYEIDKRESEIGLLNTINTKQRYLMITLGIILSTILIFLYFLYKGSTRIKKANAALKVQKEIISNKEQEKAILLKELNHRVKNNLQMISSLLSLQSEVLEGHPAKEAIVSGKHRVEALSLVHKKLYQQGVETKIEIKEYIEELVLGLIYSYQIDVNTKFMIEPISISIDKAIPISLIINELVTNSLKYAFATDREPQLKISLKENENGISIAVIDNGKGFEKDALEKSNSFGIKLVKSLVQQLKGNIELVIDKGAQWTLSFRTTFTNS
jgi:two-component sensor histidine kinase/Tfp pilus assembly protein PilF